MKHSDKVKPPNLTSVFPCCYVAACLSVVRNNGTATEVIDQLVATIPRQITQVTVPRRGINGGDHSSSVILIEKRRSFVANNKNRTVAIENAAQLAFEHLDALAASEIRNIGIGGGHDIIYSRLIQGDGKICQILDVLQSFGYMVDNLKFTCIDPITFELVYRFTFHIPGIRDFTGRSTVNEAKAFKVAADKLKLFYSSHSSMLLKPLPHLEDDGQFYPTLEHHPFNFPPVDISYPQQIIPTLAFPYDGLQEQFFETADSSYKPRILPCDLEWIKLVNRFNSSKFDVLIVTYHLVILQLNTVQHNIM